MVYIINNYDGSPLVGVNDKTINSTATSLRLPGRDYKPYGEVVVENLVWMLQNFNGVTPPLRAIQGQLWYDSVAQVIKVYDSSEWLTVGKASVGEGFPIEGQDGQLFFHVTKQQLFVWDQSAWKLIAPLGAQDGTDPVVGAQVSHTQLEACTVAGNAILKLSVGGACVAVINHQDPFVISPGDIPGFTPTNIQKGINANTNMKFVGVATNSDEATNALNLGNVLASNYMRKDQSNIPSAPNLQLGSLAAPYAQVFATNFRGLADSATTAATAGVADDANLFDGQDSSYYLNASNINSGTLDAGRLPFTPVNKAGDTNVGNLSLTGTLTLSADPASSLQAATKQYVDNKYVFTYGSAVFSLATLLYPSGFTDQEGAWNDDANYFDVFPPLGKTMANLVAFIPSMAVIHFNGYVDLNDSMRCIWINQGDRIRVWVQNTEQRFAPAGNYLAVWS